MLCRSWLLLAAVAGFIPAARADVKVHPIFSDNMVLQRDADVVVWGTAEPGEKVSVELGYPNNADDKSAAKPVSVGGSLGRRTRKGIGPFQS